MPVATARHWEHLTTDDFARLDKDRTVVILPVGAIEQHGPHLPVCVDAAIASGIVEHALTLLPADAPVCVLPTQPVGKSDEHVGYPGTLTLSATTILALWTDILESVARSGFRKVLLFNAHGGQRQLLSVVARDLRIRRGMLVVGIGYYDLGYPESLFPPEEIQYGIHGGMIETSVMLALHPDLVRMEHAGAFTSSQVELAELFPSLGRVGFGWHMRDLHADGACGDARGADASMGRRLLDHAARELVGVLLDMIRFPLDRLAPVASP